MSVRSTLHREMEVAFSKHAQPVLFRLAKYILLIGSLYFFWDSPLFWFVFLVLLILALLLHFWYRHKTALWSKSYGLWKFDKNKPKSAPLIGELTEKEIRK